MKALLAVLIFFSFQAHADQFECKPNKKGWALINKTTEKIMRIGSDDFAFKQDCEQSSKLANRENSLKVVCMPYDGGIALATYNGKNLSPRGAIFHKAEYCFRAIESAAHNLLCVPNGEDLYVIADLKNNKYILEHNSYYKLYSCAAGVASASSEDNYICGPHVKNQDRHFHIYDRTTGETLTDTAYGKISSCLTDLRSQQP